MCERVYTRNGAIINIIDFNFYHGMEECEVEIEVVWGSLWMLMRWMEMWKSFLPIMTTR